jgi:hypothetical protein
MNNRILVGKRLTQSRNFKRSYTNRNARNEKVVVGYFYLPYVEISDNVLEESSAAWPKFRYDISKKIGKLTKRRCAFFSLTPKKNNNYFVIGIKYKEESSLNTITQDLYVIENLFKTY